MRGVILTRVGYTGGSSSNPTYHRLSDHTESVEVQFDSEVLPYEEVLNFFWRKHDPFGKKSNQYMSAIFYHNEEQQKIATQSIEKIEKSKNRKVVTKLLPAKEFYLAEDYHQKFYLSQLPDLMKYFKFTPSKLATSPLATKLNGHVSGAGTGLQFKEDMKLLNLSKEDILEINKAFN
ncbi:msrA [Lepeophtheirus salmonis]|uniref:peptide-methionine (S)-S-oxide reductase n=2 Tax=Lepeophtheirus salmonis TaxID=72036 RepID=A0A7R8CR76_LEPSM|nr:peptide methionine sulfoxide reductase-like [Lepeophtheirus salmonis]CAB4060432.1 msrA [Lepeophtheirus salmonis]CAF2865537.1 msrA [Lepeophtheirus salmonis]